METRKVPKCRRKVSVAEKSAHIRNSETVSTNLHRSGTKLLNQPKANKSSYKEYHTPLWCPIKNCYSVVDRLSEHLREVHKFKSGLLNHYLCISKNKMYSSSETDSSANTIVKRICSSLLSVRTWMSQISRWHVIMSSV